MQRVPRRIFSQEEPAGQFGQLRIVGAPPQRHEDQRLEKREAAIGGSLGATRRRDRTPRHRPPARPPRSDSPRAGQGLEPLVPVKPLSSDLCPAVGDTAMKDRDSSLRDPNAPGTMSIDIRAPCRRSLAPSPIARLAELSDRWASNSVTLGLLLFRSGSPAMGRLEALVRFEDPKLTVDLGGTIRFGFFAGLVSPRPRGDLLRRLQPELAGQVRIGQGIQPGFFLPMPLHFLPVAADFGSDRRQSSGPNTSQPW